MEKMANAFPNTQQAATSMTCGSSCLVNVYEHFGISISLKKILDDLHITTDEGTYVAQLARHALRHALQTNVYSSNTFNLSPDWMGKRKDVILEELKEYLVKNSTTDWTADGLYLLYYLLEGGNLVITDLTTTLFDKLLDEKNIVIACVEQSWLWGKRKILGKTTYDNVSGKVSGHYVVVYGKKGNEYLVSDPYPTKLKSRNGLYSISKDTLLVSVLIWSKQIIAIKK